MNKKSKLSRVVISIEKGSVWPIVKVCNHDNIEVIIVNTDKSSIWKPQIEYDCDREIEELSNLADGLKGMVDEAGERIRK